jgi:hypothetical protein
MLSKFKSMRGRVGPLGSALAAAALTAAAFAAVSVAQNDGGAKDTEKSDEGDPRVERHFVPGGPGLWEEDREAMESFRKCMEDQGVELPEPPDPGELGPGEMPDPPKPPTEAERAEIEKAHEACKDKLPEGAEFGLHGCGDGPAPGRPDESGTREGGDSDSAVS